MSYQFGIGNMYVGPIDDEVEFGCLQGATIDFSFERAQIYCGSALYSFDVRIHTASITGRANYAEIDALSWYKMIGGYNFTEGDTSLTIKNTTSPASFRTRLVTVTDSVTMTLTLNQCRSDSLSFSMERTAYIIPDFGFTIFADTDGNVGTISLGDAS